MSAKSRYGTKPTTDSEETAASTSTRRKSTSSIVQDEPISEKSAQDKPTSRKRSLSIAQDESTPRKRSLSTSTSTSSRRNSQSSERELPSEAFSSDNEYTSSPRYSPPNSPPVNIDKKQSTVQSNLGDEEEIKVERLVRHFINVFIQNPNLWKEFKEVIDLTSNPVTIPSVKGKEVQRHTSVSETSRVIYNV
jgi:hypothetical protein